MNFSLSRNWWLVMLRGVLAILFGVLALFMPGAAWFALALLFGAYAFVDGLFALGTAVSGRVDEGPWWSLVLEGVIGLAVGVVTFIQPGITELALVYLIAFWAIATGIFEIGAALRIRQHIANEWLLALSGIISVAFGVILAAAPAYGAVAVVWLIGVYAIVFGVLMLVLGFQLLGRSRRISYRPRG
jgi:uncharacterized membrane protein HdeD (DUF308 family)